MARQRYTDVRGFVQNGNAPLYASSIHKAGDFLIWDTTNAAQIAASAGGPAAAVSGADNTFLGRANEDYAKVDGTVKTRISYCKATPLTEFLVWTYHPTAASSVPAPLVNLGVAYEMWYQSAALGWAVDISETTDTMWIISGYHSGNKSTDGLPNWPDSATAGTNQYPPVWVAPLTAKCTLVR